MNLVEISLPNLYFLNWTIQYSLWYLCYRWTDQIVAENQFFFLEIIAGILFQLVLDAFPFLCLITRHITSKHIRFYKENQLCIMGIITSNPLGLYLSDIPRQMTNNFHPLYFLAKCICSVTPLMNLRTFRYTVVARSSLYFVLLNYSYKYWPNIETRDSFRICSSWGFQNCHCK